MAYLGNQRILAAGGTKENWGWGVKIVGKYQNF